MKSVLVKSVGARVAYVVALAFVALATTLAAPAGAATPVLANDKFKWFYWLGFILAAELRRSGCWRPRSGTTCG